MQENVIRDAKTEAAAVMDSAAEEGKQMAEKAAAETEEMIRALREEAEKEKEAAVSDVIDHLI